VCVCVCVCVCMSDVCDGCVLDCPRSTETILNRLQHQRHQRVFASLPISGAWHLRICFVNCLQTGPQKYMWQTLCYRKDVLVPNLAPGNSGMISSTVPVLTERIPAQFHILHSRSQVEKRLSRYCPKRRIAFKTPQVSPRLKEAGHIRRYTLKRRNDQELTPSPRLPSLFLRSRQPFFVTNPMQ